jgi:hypothetical protein
VSLRRSTISEPNERKELSNNETYLEVTKGIKPNDEIRS